MELVLNKEARVLKEVQASYYLVDIILFGKDEDDFITSTSLSLIVNYSVYIKHNLANCDTIPSPSLNFSVSHFSREWKEGELSIHNLF